jgi:excisionase family DNA binding protein
MAKQALALLTTAQVALRLGVRQETVQVWIGRGRFPGAIRLGRDWFIPPTDLIGFSKRRPGRPRKDD